MKNLPIYASDKSYLSDLPATAATRAFPWQPQAEVHVFIWEHIKSIRGN